MTINNFDNGCYQFPLIAVEPIKAVLKKVSSAKRVI